MAMGQAVRTVSDGFCTVFSPLDSGCLGIKTSKLKPFDWKMLREGEIMFKKSLYKAALAYFSDKVGSQEKKRLQKALLPLPAIVLNLNGKRLWLKRKSGMERQEAEENCLYDFICINHIEVV